MVYLYRVLWKSIRIFKIYSGARTYGGRGTARYYKLSPNFLSESWKLTLIESRCVITFFYVWERYALRNVALRRSAVYDLHILRQLPQVLRIIFLAFPVSFSLYTKAKILWPCDRQVIFHWDKRISSLPLPSSLVRTGLRQRFFNLGYTLPFYIYLPLCSQRSFLLWSTSTTWR
jgi:hypothetical protein